VEGEGGRGRRREEEGKRGWMEGDMVRATLV